VNCYYCDRITAADPSYVPRPAEFDTGSEAPRCAWHWRLVCDHCGQAGHFMARFHCTRSGRLLCREAGQLQTAYGDAGPWEYWWLLHCPDCGEQHASLDYAELTQVHPWQLDPAAVRERRWLSSETQLTRYPPRHIRDADLETLTDADSDANWSANADIWDANYDERGDTNRKYSSDPVLLEFLGDVRGQRVLDAGSGGGYLSRLLARSGADMVAVENARRLHEIALAYQEREPLTITFHHGSISAMPFLPDASCDAVVANYVLIDVRDYEGAIAEIARVLKPGGRFVFSLAHNGLDFAWHIPAPDSPRREDRTAWMDDRYFIRRAGYVQWGDLMPILTFHRPLRDYVAACKRVGLELRDLDEPELSAEGLRELSPEQVRGWRRLAVSYVLKVVKASGDGR
jgi:SAM-dependent methyltransferase